MATAQIAKKNPRLQPGVGVKPTNTTSEEIDNMTVRQDTDNAPQLHPDLADTDVSNTFIDRAAESNRKRMSSSFAFVTKDALVSRYLEQLESHAFTELPTEMLTGLVTLMEMLSSQFDIPLRRIVDGQGDQNYWLNRCADVLDVIDLNDYDSDDLAYLSGVLSSMCPVRPSLTVIDGGA